MYRVSLVLVLGIIRDVCNLLVLRASKTMVSEQKYTVVISIRGWKEQISTTKIFVSIPT
jgi:hypothetical protein